MSKSQTMVEELYDKLISAEKLEIQLKELNKEIQTRLSQCSEAMSEEGIDGIRYNGVEFKPSTEQVFILKGKDPYTKWDECQDWFDWLNEIGAEGIIQFKKTVHHTTRNKFLREYLDDNPDEHLPDFIGESFFDTVKFNKSEIKRQAIKAEGGNKDGVL